MGNLPKLTLATKIQFLAWGPGLAASDAIKQSIAKELRPLPHPLLPRLTTSTSPKLPGAGAFVGLQRRNK